MSPTQTLMTAEELFALPDNGCRHELLNGELRTMTPAGFDHGVIAMRLGLRVASFAEAHQLGMVPAAETGFRLTSNPDTVRAPDLAFVRQARIPASGVPKGFWPGAPDLAAEVVSPGDTYEEVAEKVADWLRAGTELVWVINPRNRTVAVHAGSGDVRMLSAADELSGGNVLPGFTCRVSELFP